MDGVTGCPPFRPGWLMTLAAWLLIRIDDLLRKPHRHPA